MSDDFLNNTLDFTDQKRRKLLHEIEKENQGVIPTEQTAATLYLRALSDMDHAAIQHSRVKTEEKAADNDASVAEVIRDVVRRLGGANPYKLEAPAENVKPPELPSQIEESVSIQDSELETGRVSETIDEFNKRMGLDDD